MSSERASEGTPRITRVLCIRPAEFSLTGPKVSATLEQVEHRTPSVNTSTVILESPGQNPNLALKCLLHR